MKRQDSISQKVITLCNKLIDIYEENKKLKELVEIQDAIIKGLKKDKEILKQRVLNLIEKIKEYEELIEAGKFD